VAVSLFVFLEHFPLSALLAVVGVVMVITFFVTSSDSDSMVIDIIAAGERPDPPVKQRIFWAVLGGAHGNGRLRRAAGVSGDTPPSG
jgi:choline/glycine/proline betaine transport protein